MYKLDFSVMIPFIPILIRGLSISLLIGICSFLIAALLSIIVGLLRYNKPKNIFMIIIYYILGAYIEIFRGTPLLVQLFIFYFAFPSIGITIPAILAAIIAMSLNSAAYYSENVRASIMSIDKGQYEAAKTLGYNKLQINLYIILPQAIRIAIPPFMNGFSTIIKETSIVSTIPIVELMRTGNQIYAKNFRSFEIYVTLALIYFMVNYPITFLAKHIEARLSKWIS